MKKYATAIMIFIVCISSATFADDTVLIQTVQKTEKASGGCRKIPRMPNEKEPQRGIEIIWQDPRAELKEELQRTNPDDGSMNNKQSLK